MELLDGKNLRELLAGGPMPYKTVLGYAIEIAHGLAAAHEKGIAHRDLKPENIFVTNGRPGEDRRLRSGERARSRADGDEIVAARRC